MFEQVWFTGEVADGAGLGDCDDEESLSFLEERRGGLENVSRFLTAKKAKICEDHSEALRE